jgi:hypothetical protein
VLQRDLWMFFNWLQSGKEYHFAEPQLSADEVHAARARLQRPLTAIIRRLALSSQEIQSLPDNYAAAVASGNFAKRFDPKHPDRPYLPPESFADDGPWVCVGRSDGITAPQHLREENPYTNSVFLVFVRLPGDRAANVAHLTQLFSFDQPFLIHDPERADDGSFPLIPNPALPQFPKGTELALVRRALLINSSHRIVASPIAESVQLRILFGDPRARTKNVLDNDIRATTRRGSAWQAFHEVRLSRIQLLAGQGGGLRTIGPGESDFKTGFVAHPYDEFERSRTSGQQFPGRSLLVIRQQCSVCHSLPSIYSFQSLFDLRSGVAQNNGAKVRPYPLSQISALDVVEMTVKWQESRPNWIVLRMLLAD